MHQVPNRLGCHIYRYLKWTLITPKIDWMKNNLQAWDTANTALNNKYWQFEYNRAPQVLCNVPFTFHSLLIGKFYAYFDGNMPVHEYELLIFSKDEKWFRSLLERVLGRIKSHRLHASPKNEFQEIRNFFFTKHSRNEQNSDWFKEASISSSIYYLRCNKISMQRNGSSLLRLQNGWAVEDETEHLPGDTNFYGDDETTGQLLEKRYHWEIRLCGEASR